jgi:hypothetical protein
MFAIFFGVVMIKNSWGPQYDQDLGLYGARVSALGDFREIT